VKKMIFQNLGGNSAEIKALTAGNYGRGQLVKLGGRKNKDHVLRRLLKSFQERIERADRKHVNLVYDVNPVFKIRRRINDLISDITDVINTVVRCGVHFKHVCGRTRVDRLTSGAFAARASVYGRQTVDRLGKDLRAGGLSGTSRAAEKICVRKLVVCNLVFQNRGYMLLTANFIEATRTPFSI
jgi:hypothetical protein